MRMPAISNLGLERLCVFGMPPVAFISLAADLGCACLGIGLEAMLYYNPHGYPAWSLRGDSALRREMIAAMRDRGIRIALCEGFGIAPGRDPGELESDLDIVAELGCERINAVSTDREMQRTVDGFAAIAEMAKSRGIKVVTEIGVGPLSTLAKAMAVIDQVGRDKIGVLIDTMHYFRLGGSIEEIGALDPLLIGYVQLCDAPLASPFESYMEEALHERMVPGTGNLPLREFLSLLAGDIVVSLEVPQRSLAEAGLGPKERVGPCVAAARAMIAEAGRRAEDNAISVPGERTNV